MVKLNDLTPEEEKVMLYNGTEQPFTGEYNDFFVEGTYLCRRCDAPLYKSDAKFHSDCGWPSFDQEIPGAVRKSLDADGVRTEITCVNCGGHLGHVFEGEGITPSDTRHCVNSLSLKFVPKYKREIAVFGGGCFWCTEAIFSMLNGVVSVKPGYAGGTTVNPNYESVSMGNTGHVEVIKIEFDPAVIPYRDLLDVFFHTHNPTTMNQQGADTGTQYRSIILYTSEEQKVAAENFVSDLENSGKFKDFIVTEIEPLDKFYEAEDYHKNYFEKNIGAPYCQMVISPKLTKLREKYKAKLKV